MKLIITGATGFIGQNIAEDFHGKGMQITATGRSLSIGSELQKKGINFIAADITNRIETDRVFSPVDCVIHCAGKAGDWGKYKEFYETNVIGTQNVIEACKTNGIKKVIFISSPSVYFTGKDRHNVLEKDPLPKKQFNYGKTKLIAEKELLSQSPEVLQTIILRPRAVYGQYDNTFVPRILKLSEKKHIPMINKGNALVDITYVGNLMDVIHNSLSAPDKAWNEVYNISNGDPISVNVWFSLVMQMFNKPFHPKNIPEPLAVTIAGIQELISLLPFGNKTPAMTRISVGYMAKSLTMSIEKAKLKLNYSPKISNQEGFEQYKHWLDMEN